MQLAMNQTFKCRPYHVVHLKQTRRYVRACLERCRERSVHVH